MSEQPFLPFARPAIDEETIADVAAVLRSGWITSGPRVKELEAKLSERMGGRPVRAFANGSATLECGLRIAGVRPGDEVITSPISWVASANAILEVGARPVFVDVDPATRNLDLDLVEAAITERTRAILPVYLAGRPVDLDRLFAIAARHRLRIVEDAAQALGSTWQGRAVGSFGDLTSFSFQANKNLTTVEGGCLVLRDEEEARLAEKLRFQGVTRSGVDGVECDVLGGKWNLPDVLAVIGLGQLRRIDERQARRGALARRYFDVLRAAGLPERGVELPPEEHAHTNWHMFQVVLPLERLGCERAQVMASLVERGIGAGVHYPAIHLFRLYRDLEDRAGQLPVAERIGRSILTLPLFPEMADSDVDRVVLALADVVAARPG